MPHALRLRDTNPGLIGAGPGFAFRWLFPDASLRRLPRAHAEAVAARGKDWVAGD